MSLKKIKDLLATWQIDNIDLAYSIAQEENIEYRKVNYGYI